MQLRKFSPSAKEVEELQLKDLFVKHTTLNINCNKTSMYVSGADFVCPVDPTVTGAASSSIPSKYQISFNKIQSQMRILETSQRGLVGEVKNLKSIIDEQRSYFDLELSKLRDILLNKVYILNFRDSFAVRIVE